VRRLEAGHPLNQKPTPESPLSPIALTNKDHNIKAWGRFVTHIDQNKAKTMKIIDLAFERQCKCRGEVGDVI